MATQSAWTIQTKSNNIYSFLGARERVLEKYVKDKNLMNTTIDNSYFGGRV
jgi:hypothetical protein